jgi:hypothetical protein
MTFWFTALWYSTITGESFSSLDQLVVASPPEQPPIPIVEPRPVLVQTGTQDSGIRKIDDNRLSYDPHVVWS